MKKIMIAAIVAAAGGANAQLANYSQDFEGLNAGDAAALANDGWLVGANVFDPSGTNFLYNYFAFPAPNGNLDGGGFRFSAIATGEGGVDQGAQQLSVFNDYNNADHNIGNRIEANVFREYIIGAGDVGSTVTFTFDAKLGDLGGATTAAAFIKILDQNNGFALTAFETQDTTSIPNTWSTYSLSTTIQPAQVGTIFQIGFLNTASNFDSSGVFYDNINLVIPAPASAALLGLGGLAAARRRR
ncbi:MAG: hypothetical protein ACTS22_03955 [Phycisphaerales bacterium]